MARHRNIRGLNYEEEYNDVYDEYSRSVEEESCISPRTARQYLFADDDAVKSLEKVEEEGYGEEEGEDAADLSLIDAKTYSCLEAIQDVVGESIPEEVIVAAIKKCKYDSEKALDMLLNRNNSNTQSTPKTTQPPPPPKIQQPTPSQDKSKTTGAVANVIKSSGAPVRNNSKGDLTKLNTSEAKSSKKPTSTTLEPPSSKPSPLSATSSEQSNTPTSSPYSTPKLTSRHSNQHLKSTIAKPAAEISELYNRKRISGSRLNLNLVIVGHVDAGKSTIMGHLLALLGEVSKKTLHKNEVDARKAGKASFSFAWVLDETEEERSRGITIDVAIQRFSTEARAVTILDAPGHRDFIPNMIAGATKADVALLVIDATKGEFETGFEAGGQTAEHTVLLRSLGVSQLAVVVNKLDNVAFSEARYIEIVDRLRRFLRAVGFKVDGGAVHFVPVSGLTGDNLALPSKEAAFAWYSGPTLVQIIDGFAPNERPVTKPFRLAVNDIFKGQTSGVCVAGKIDSGFVEVGQRLLIRPANELCTVKNIFLNEELGSSLTTASEAFAGDVLTLNLTLPAEGNATDQLAVGSVLCDLTSPPATLATRFEARIVLFSHLETSNATVPTPPLTQGASVLLYSVCLNSEVARISKLVALLDSKTNGVLRRNPRLLAKGSSALVEFTSAVAGRPLVVEPYSAFKEYGRFIFRAGNQSLGAGIVTKIIA